MTEIPDYLELSVLRPFVTEAIAREVRVLRREQHCTWRKVAEAIAERYPESPVVSAHPAYGEALCNLAGIGSDE